MIDIPLPIIGKAILIREMRDQDIELLYDLETDNEVKRYVGGCTLSRPKHDWIVGMRQIRVTPTRSFRSLDALLPLIVTCKATGKFAGRAALGHYHDIRRFEIQVIIAKQYWGKRLGKEAVELLMGVAFNNLNALSVVSVVHPENNQSLKLVIELGFTLSGTKESSGWDNGHYVDEYKPSA
jgi:RimJ/RimL family protein N-acetyltransferase